MTQTEAEKRASLKYKKNHLKRVPLDLQKPDYEKLKEAANQAGESVNGFVKNSINERIDRMTAEGTIDLTAVSADQEPEEE
ncbi:MAG: hypothetical protein Q4B85_12600 [Lachnospiraceae bacterium]|nr:hypothetical protein [Lachnospiraceae bacterium]